MKVKNFVLLLVLPMFFILPIWAQQGVAGKTMLERLESEGLYVHQLQSLKLIDCEYVFMNVATGEYLKGGGSWGTHLFAGKIGVPLKIIPSGAKYRLYSGINGGYVNIGGFIDGTIDTYVDMDIKQIADGIFTISAINNYLMKVDEETSLVDFYGEEASDTKAQWKIVNAELLQYVNEVNLHLATENNPVDATFMIPCADIENAHFPSNEAWIVEENGTKIVWGIQTIDSEPIMEVYRHLGVTNGFSVSQTITLPPGLYKLQVQGFYRDGYYDQAAIAHNNGTEEICASLFANEKSIPLKSIFSENRKKADKGFAVMSTAGYVPNSFTQAGYTFQQGAYENELMFIVEEGHEEVTIGIKGTASDKPYNWTAFDNFRLTYYGSQSIEANQSYYVMNVAKQKYISNGSYWGTHIMVSDHGIQIVPQKTGAYYILYSGFFSPVDDRDGAPYGAIGLEGYVNNYQEISHRITNVQSGTYFIQALNGALLSSNNDDNEVNFIGYDTNDSHAHWIFIPEETVDVNRIVALEFADETHPIDVTYKINDPGMDPEDARWEWYAYRDDGTEWYAGAGTMDSESISEIYRGTGSGEYSVFQTIKLQTGHYKLKVQAFYRDGSYFYAGQRHNDGTEQLDAILFAGDVYEVPIKSIFDEAKMRSERGWSTWTEAGGFIPNTMAEAGYAFQTGAYENELDFDVTEEDEGEFQIGIMGLESFHYQNWLAFDNFRLYYYGNKQQETTHTVTYMIDGETIYTIDLNIGGTISHIQAPEKEGYTFKGWNITQEIMGNEDVVITGTYEVNSYIIYYYVNNEIWATDEVNYGDPVVLRESCESDNPNHTFDGWDGEHYDTMPAHDIRYDARFTDGIDGLQMDGSRTVKVYAVDGRLIHSNVPVKDIQKVLPAGIYIINGQKIIVK